MKFDNVYFINGTAYAGKSTMVKMMQVEGVGTIYDTSDGELTYYGIILADGTEGCIKKEYIDEVKVPIDISGQ